MLKIYTKTGDRGQTSLYGGKRVGKDDARVEAYGTVDELNSAIGVVIAETQNSRLPAPERSNGGQAKLKTQNKRIEDILKSIQSDLFVIGAMLAGDRKDAEVRSRKLEVRTKDLEKLIDWMAEKMPQQRHFILPGGSKPGAFLHLARTICRRAERRVVSMQSQQPTANSQQLVIYINRLSDFLFTLAKWVNRQEGIEETEWKQD